MLGTTSPQRFSRLFYMDIILLLKIIDLLNTIILKLFHFRIISHLFPVSLYFLDTISTIKKKILLIPLVKPKKESGQSRQTFLKILIILKYLEFQHVKYRPSQAYGQKFSSGALFLYLTFSKYFYLQSIL